MDGDEVTSKAGETTNGAPSLGDANMSRGTMLTDRWRTLNADLFEMKLQVKVNEPTHPNIISNRIGVLQHINNPR